VKLIVPAEDKGRTFHSTSAARVSEVVLGNNCRHSLIGIKSKWKKLLASVSPETQSKGGEEVSIGSRETTSTKM